MGWVGEGNVVSAAGRKIKYIVKCEAALREQSLKNPGRFLVRWLGSYLPHNFAYFLIANLSWPILH
jgi:hypothetical protein